MRKKLIDNRFFGWMPRVVRALGGYFTFRGIKLPRAMVAGILGVILLYISVAGTVSIATPWWSRGDTKQHVDYIWRVYKLEIPRWHDGIQYKPFVELAGYKKQAVSANPPLFYAIHAPFVGPLLKGGHWQEAIAVGRAINVLFGVLCIIALAWAGWLFGGKRKALFAVTVPALAVLLYRFTRLNVDYANDAQLTLITTLSIIFSYKLLKHGLKRNYLIYLTVISALGMLTKATYIVFLAVSLLAVMIAVFLHGKKDNIKNFVRGAIIASVIFMLALIVSGWYYYWNYKTSGTWYSASPPGYTGGRSYQSLTNVLNSKKLWSLVYGSFATSVVASVAILCFSLAGYLNTTKKSLKFIIRDKAIFWSVILMAVATLGMFVIQIKFAVGYGAINFRYMLPAILPISLFLAYGLLNFKHAKGQLVTLAISAMVLCSMWTYANGHLGSLFVASAANHISGLVQGVLLALIPIGILLLGVSVFVLSDKTE